MNTRWPFVPHARQVHRMPAAAFRSRLGLVLVAVLVAGVAACTETFSGGDACPSLCPSKPTAFKDTIVDAVILDTTLGGYPELGLSPTLLLANRPDTLVTRGVLRFDVLPTSYLPNKTEASASITAVDSVVLVLPLDTSGWKGSAPVTVEAFDVDTTQNDSSQVVVKSLFRADRLIGSTVVTPSTQGDTLRIPIAKAVLAAKIAANSRLRVGLRMSGAGGQLRIIAFSQGAGAPYLRFDPSTDTTYAPIPVGLSTSIELATSDVNLAYLIYGIVDKGSIAPDASTLVIGGFPAYRTYLRFTLPKSITDSSTIVRAEVLLTQRPSRFANTADTVSVLPLVPTTTTSVSDIRRILDLSADGAFAALDSARLVPRDSGQRAINILSLARSWGTLPADVPRAVAFRISVEGGQPAELRFFSSEAAASLRPRLRITYLPRTETAIP
ncbi:MAG: hypothetical protein IPP90_12085 [Gemmatimonadaceae bacterium]|nr:hypothetical protein [Gemmatimonadaceae bacterium]